VRASSAALRGFVWGGVLARQCREAESANEYTFTVNGRCGRSTYHRLREGADETPHLAGRVAGEASGVEQAVHQREKVLRLRALRQSSHAPCQRICPVVVLPSSALTLTGVGLGRILSSPGSPSQSLQTPNT
jgi:hypothetical protein